MFTASSKCARLEEGLTRVLDAEYGKKRTFEDFEEEIIYKKMRLEQVPPRIFKKVELRLECSLGGIDFSNVKYDGGSDENVLPLVIYQFLELEGMRYFYPERSPIDGVRAIGWVDGVLVTVGRFVFEQSFLVVDAEERGRMPIVLGRSFYKDVEGIVDHEYEELESDDMLIRDLFDSDKENDLEDPASPINYSSCDSNSIGEFSE